MQCIRRVSNQRPFGLKFNAQPLNHRVPHRSVCAKCVCCSGGITSFPQDCHTYSRRVITMSFRYISVENNDDLNFVYTQSLASALDSCNYPNCEQRRLRRVCICADSPELLLLAYPSYRCKRGFISSFRHSFPEYVSVGVYQRLLRNAISARISCADPYDIVHKREYN